MMQRSRSGFQLEKALTQLRFPDEALLVITSGVESGPLDYSVDSRARFYCPLPPSIRFSSSNV